MVSLIQVTVTLLISGLFGHKNSALRSIARGGAYVEAFRSCHYVFDFNLKGQCHEKSC